MVHVMRNPDFAYTHLHICTADQPLCFRYTDRRILLLLKSKVSSFYPFSVAVQAAAHILYLFEECCTSTCIHCQVLEGYGQTECGAICCLQMPGDGTIGGYRLLDCWILATI